MSERPPRPSRQAAGWGALWGVALGFWLLAPRLLDYFRLLPHETRVWWNLHLSLSLVFAVLGALLGFFGAAPLVLLQALRRRPLRDPELAYGLASALLVPAAYLLAALGVEWISPGPPMEIDSYAAVVRPALWALVALAPLLVLAYRQAAGLGHGRRLAFALALLALCGIGSLPLRTSAAVARPRAPTAALHPLPDRQRPTTPLLVVGLDAGNWRTLRPPLERGELPTFARLLAHGTRGSVSAIWPPFWSDPAWAAIVTGRSREEVGIYEDLVAEAPGLPPFQVPLVIDFMLDPVVASAFFLVQTDLIRLAHARRDLLPYPPFWELLSRSGVKTGVVRFRFTYPAEGQADYVISDRVGEDLWQWVGVRAESGAGAAWPPAEADRLIAPFLRPIVTREFDDLLAHRDRPQPRDATKNPLEVLEIALRSDEQTTVAAEELLRAHPELSVLAVYLGGLDGICHAFWQYRFPDEFPDGRPDDADVAELGGVIERYWRFLDRRLGNLIAAFPESPNVVVLADHGVESIHTNPLWKGWHSAHGGIFLAAGPDVARRAEEIDVSYFDVLPTVVDLAGFAAPEGLRGSSLLSAQNPAPKPTP